MAFTIPSRDVAAFTPSQSEWHTTDIAILAAALSGTGVVSGCGVTAQGTPDMTVAVAAGVILAAGVTVAVSSGNVTVGTADATNPRIDLITASAAGTKTITAGTAAAAPKPPDLPSGHVGLAMVYVAATDTDIDADQITDKRAIVPAPVLPAHGARVKRSANQSVGNNTLTAIQFTAEDYDTDTFHDNSTGNTKLTIPSIAGVTTGLWAINASGYADLASDGAIRLDGSTVIAFARFPIGASSIGSHPIATHYVLSAGQYVEFLVRTPSGSGNCIFDAGVSPIFSIAFLGKVS